MKQTPAIQLKHFIKEDYDKLISWIDSAETLMQFAGPYLSFPLTHEQLDENNADVNRSCYSIINAEDNLCIGHAEIFLTGTAARIGRVIIIKQLRGLGIGKKLMAQLLEISFNKLHQQMAELYVFDWNDAAIKCYEQCGFTSYKENQLVREVNGKTWIAFNMSITKEKWLAGQNKYAIL